MRRNHSAAMPASLAAARVLMYVVAGLSALLAVALLVGYGITDENVATTVTQVLPGAASFYLALKLRGGRRIIWRCVIGLQVLWILFAFGRISQGDPTGVLGVIIPVAVLILVTRGPARTFTRGPG